MSLDLILIGFLAALISAPMGCLVSWHRLAFLADALGHAAILGVAIAVLTQLHEYLGVGLVFVVIVVVIALTQKRLQLISESVLAIMSQVGLAGGLLLMSTEDDFEHRVAELLFGDIASINNADMVLLSVVTFVVLAVLFINWKKFLLISMSWEISKAEGLSVQKNNIVMYLLIALMVSVLIKVMGVLLIAALLIIPPTAVRWFSVNPEKMVLFTFLFGLMSLYLGLWISTQWQLLTAPTIVIVAVVSLLMSQLLKKMQNKH